MATTQADGIPATQKARVERTNKDFVDGICSGYLTYYHEYQDKSLSDNDVYTSSHKISLTRAALIDSMLVTALAGLKPCWKIGRYSDSSGERC